MYSRATPEAKILDAKAATGIGTPQQIQDFRHLVLALHTSGSANFTVKIQGSISEDMPDFSAAQSVSNQWDYVQIKDLQNGSSIGGDTGVAAAGTDDHRLFEVNTNGLRWLCAEITAYAAGEVTLYVKPFRA